jgi:hypothetical protein
MKKTKKWFVVIGVVLVIVVFFLSCDNGAGLPQMTAEDEANLEAATEIAFGEIAESEIPPVGITFGEDEDSMWVTFTDYENPSYPGITVNGTVTMTISLPDENTMVITMSGTLTFTGTGAPVQTLTFNVTITLTDIQSVEPTATFSGHIEMDGTKFDASTFTMEDIPIDVGP